ncbi:hypothetical protein Aperf_G00000074077 [Anoplocephala perfoliata]
MVSENSYAKVRALLDLRSRLPFAGAALANALSSIPLVIVDLVCSAFLLIVFFHMDSRVCHHRHFGITYITFALFSLVADTIFSSILVRALPWLGRPPFEAAVMRQWICKLMSFLGTFLAGCKVNLLLAHCLIHVFSFELHYEPADMTWTVPFLNTVCILLAAIMAITSAIVHGIWVIGNRLVCLPDPEWPQLFISYYMTHKALFCDGIIQSLVILVSCIVLRRIYIRIGVTVSGGAGFVGSHLVDALMNQGHYVTVLDNLFTGDRQNLDHWMKHPRFEFITHDVSNPIYLEADQIYHLASPASPPSYMANPIKTLKANLMGSINLLGLARRAGATFLLASTSEVYGDPEVHPQSESYWGNVNPDGVRSCYDESKRAAESLAYAYFRREGIPVRVARIFNTYGPRMQLNDGRVISNFILQALYNRDICLYGDGSYTRSFMYISDLVEGLILLMNSNVTGPVNLGNPHEFTIRELANIIKNLTNSSSKIINCPEAIDDPKRRQPDITRAKTLLGWEPKIQLKEGLQLTIKAFRESLKKASFQLHSYPKSERYRFQQF